MICPRWTPRAKATLANLPGRSRQASSRQIPFPCRDFNTSRGSDDDGFETPQSLHSGRQHNTSSRPTATAGQAPYRTRLGTGVDGRLRFKSNADGRRRPWTDGSDGDAESETPRQVWPQLQRRERGARQRDDSAGNAALAIPKPVFSPQQNVQNPPGTKDSAQVMLVIDGLSPNLSATDFYRITPNDLSDWQSVIRKVQLQRTPDTFEPLGRYLVTFSTAQAAASYRDRLVRLHGLNGFRLRSASGLWESSVPASLKISLASPPAASTAAAAFTETSDLTASDMPSTESVVDIANTFTIAPGSQNELPIQRRRVANVRPWTKRLTALVENLGYGDRPTVLMVEVYPPNLTAQELHQFIRRDGQTRGLKWQVSIPQHLKMDSSEQAPTRSNAIARGTGKKDMDKHENEHDEVASDKQQNMSLKLNDRDTWEKLKGRFVFACADEAEAKRFQQSWNHRALTTLRPRPARYIVYASVINW
ncbi:hypothetical protein ACHAQJ_003979 [Trichoderma viride]